MIISKKKYSELLKKYNDLVKQWNEEVILHEKDNMKHQERYRQMKKRVGSLNAIINEMRQKTKIKNSEYWYIVNKHKVQEENK